MNINFRNPLKGFPSKFIRRQLVTLDSTKIQNKDYFNSFITLLTCQICKEVLSNPYDCEKCDNTFCFECISNNKCLFCEGDRKKIKQSSRGIKTMLSQLIFKCDCKSEIAYDEMNQHSANCYGEYSNSNDEAHTTNETNLNININIPQFLRETEKDFDKISKETLKLKNEISCNMDSFFKSLYKKKKKKENLSQEISSQENFNSSVKFDCVGDVERKPKSFSDCLEISETGGKNLLKKLDEIEMKIGEIFNVLNKDFFFKKSENFDKFDTNELLNVFEMNFGSVKEYVESKFCNLNEMLKNCFKEMKDISNKDFIKMEILVKRKEVEKEREKDNLINEKIKDFELNEKIFEEILEVKNLFKEKIESEESASNCIIESYNTLSNNLSELKENFFDLDRKLQNNKKNELQNQVHSSEFEHNVVEENFQKGFSVLKENQSIILIRLEDFKSKLESMEQQKINNVIYPEYKNIDKPDSISNNLNDAQHFQDMFKINWCSLCEKVDYFYGFLKCEICIFTICKSCVSLCKQCKKLYCVQCLKCSQCNNACCSNCRIACSSCQTITTEGDTNSIKSYCSSCISKCTKCCSIYCLYCLTKCFICNENICHKCSNSCHLCKISSCYPCGSIKDYITCPSCGEKTCFNCVEKCMLCDLEVCTACQFTCQGCNKIGCLKNKTLCNQCKKAFCNRCNLEQGHSLCYICDKNFCDSCVKKNLTKCKKCDLKVCRSCYSVCFKCKKNFCLNCKIRCDSCAEITCDTCSYLCSCEKTSFCEKCLFGINPVCKADCLFINGKAVFNSSKTRSNFSLPENFEAKFFVESLYKENRLMIGLTDNSEYEEDSVYYIDNVWLFKIPTGEKFSTEKGIETFLNPVKEKDFFIVTKIGSELFFKINFVNSPVAFVLGKERFNKYYFYLENDSSLLLDKTRVVLVYARKL